MHLPSYNCFWCVFPHIFIKQTYKYKQHKNKIFDTKPILTSLTPPKCMENSMMQRWIRKQATKKPQAESYRPPIDKISQHFFRNFMEVWPFGPGWGVDRWLVVMVMTIGDVFFFEWMRRQSLIEVLEDNMQKICKHWVISLWSTVLLSLFFISFFQSKSFWHFAPIYLGHPAKPSLWRPLPPSETRDWQADVRKRQSESSTEVPAGMRSIHISGVCPYGHSKPGVAFGEVRFWRNIAKQ